MAGYIRKRTSEFRHELRRAPPVHHRQHARQALPLRRSFQFGRASAPIMPRLDVTPVPEAEPAIPSDADVE
jgi:hypothetical protein